MTILGIKNVVWLATQIFFFFQDFFTIDNWTDNGATTKVNTGTEVLDWQSETTANGSFRDMVGTALSNTAWVARLKLIVVTATGTGNHQFKFIITDKNDFDVATTTRDYLGFRTVKSVDRWDLFHGNGVTFQGGSVQSFAHSLTTETLYIELTKLSATSFKVEFFSDASFTISVESEIATISSGIIGLKFLMGIEDNVSGTATVVGTIDNIQVKNGVTVF